jgi:hypothetical protein
MATTDGAASTTHNGQRAGGLAHAADALPVDDRVSVEVLVQEATQAGFIDWLAAQLREQCGPDGIALEGHGGLLPALAAAARERVRFGPAGPVRIVVTYDPVTQRTTADHEPGVTLATLRDACLGIAVVAGELCPSVEVSHDGVLFRAG